MRWLRPAGLRCNPVCAGMCVYTSVHGTALLGLLLRCWVCARAPPCAFATALLPGPLCALVARAACKAAS
eukprot:14987944-Alexandrium_andersonii.AAC.1